MLTAAAAERAAARAMEEAAAAGLDRATAAAQEQELATLREALAFEEALRQQACPWSHRSLTESRPYPFCARSCIASHHHEHVTKGK